MSAARVIMTSNEQQNAEAPAANEAHKPNLVSEPVVNFAEKQSFKQDDLSKFYTGQDRLSLQSFNLQRVRELQENNDNLQRDILKKEKEVLNSADPLSILADIEHCRIMIARNTGEILKIYSQNDARLKRIQELEAENVRLKEEIIDMRDQFIQTHEVHARTKHAMEFFIMKEKIEKNAAEIYELNQN